MTFKELREGSEMTRSQFAEYFGIPYRTIQSWELHGESKEGRKCPEYLLKLMKFRLDHKKKPQGRWAVIGENCCVCSVCHKASIVDYYFCPECGAEMERGGEDA